MRHFWAFLVLKLVSYTISVTQLRFDYSNFYNLVKLIFQDCQPQS